MTLPRPVDAVAAVAVTAATLVVTMAFLDASSDLDRTVDGLAVVLVLAAGLPLAWRRVQPLGVLAVVTAATTGYLVVGYPYGPILALWAVAVYGVARACRPRTAAWATAAALFVLLGHLVTNDAALDGPAGLVPATAWAVVPWAIGATRRAQVEAAEQARAAALQRRLDDERRRITLEVHDVVSHGLAAIQMQADVALHVIDDDPDHAVTALQAISRSSARAFEELRTTLHLVHADDGEIRAPTPGMARLDDLCDRIRDAGVAVEVDVSGTPLALPEAVDLAAYRILQEALTNVVRHGSHRSVHADVHWGADRLELRVVNPGPVEPGRTDGLGMAGMQRRAERVGGTLAAGPAPEGFVLQAVLPCSEAT